MVTRPLPGANVERQPAPYLYVTTIGRKTGLPREIEIWFVEHDGRYYILAEHFRRAHWVRNIERESRVRVRLGRQGKEREATARVLDAERDRALWQKVQELERQKYGWGDGLPVEITPAGPEGLTAS